MWWNKVKSTWLKIRPGLMSPGDLYIEEQLQKYKKLDAEASTHVESVICMKTHFTGEPPYVGWAGLGLALEETIEYKNELETFVAWISTNPGASSNDVADMAWHILNNKNPTQKVP